jgi:opacity protein-like surface antigen
MGTRTLGLTAILIFSLILPTAAKAQQLPAAPSAWDVAVTAGSFHGQSINDANSGYWNQWHHAGEWRLTAGRYWTPHLKTEVEFGATGEGDRYVQRFATVPGSPTPYPYGAQESIRHRQGSARVTWQFLDNEWIHPYLSAGVSVDEERKRTNAYPPVIYLDPRNPSTRVVGIQDRNDKSGTTYRTGLVLAGGAKWYVSPSVFIKTGVQLGLSRPQQTVSFLAGMGFDF